MDNRENYMTISEAARVLGVTRKVIYRAIRDGQLHVLPKHPLAGDRGGKRWLVRSEVEAALKALRQP